MSHGTPDWGVTAGAVTVYQLGDLAEHAARLGSIVTFDRRGDIVFLEDFESGLDRWKTGGEGSDAGADLSTERPRSGQFTARLIAGKDGDAYAYIKRRFPLVEPSNVGLEASLSYETRTVSEMLRFEYDLAGAMYRFELLWVLADLAVQILQSDGNYKTVAAAPAFSTFAQVHVTMKLVVDLVNKRYVRCLFNRTAVDLSDYAAREMAAVGSYALESYIRHTGKGPSNIRAYYDDVIVTQNEPAEP